MTQPNPRASWKRSLAIVWIGEFFSVLTSSILQMGLIWHVTLTTGSASALSFVSLAAFLPMALLGAFAGTIVDRTSIKRLMIGADLFIAAVSLTLVFGSLGGGLSVAAVAGVLFVRALGSTLHTPAFNALTPLIAPAEALSKLAGMAAVHAVGQLHHRQRHRRGGLPGVRPDLHDRARRRRCGAREPSRLRSPALRTPAPERHTPEENAEASRHAVRAFLSETVDGYRELKCHRGLFVMLWIGFAFSVLFSPISALFPLMVFDHFGGTTTQSAIAEIAFSVGMIAASGWIGATGGLKNRALSCTLAIALFGAVTLASGLVPPSALAVFLGLTFVMGVSSPLYTAPQMALMQERVEPECMGRVFGLYGAVCSWAMPVGLIFSTLFADTIGVTRCFVLVGCGHARPGGALLVHQEHPNHRPALSSGRAVNAEKTPPRCM